MGVRDYVEDLLPVSDDYECCFHHLTGRLIESLRAGAICIDAVSTASRTVRDNREAIDADVVCLCEIACSIECNQGNRATPPMGPKPTMVPLI